MATDLEAPQDTNVVALIRGILADGQALLESQLELLRAEIKTDWQQTKRASIMLLAGVAPLFLGVTLCCFMLVHLIHWLSLPPAGDPGGWPLWACFGLVGGALCLIGGVLVGVGIGRFQSFNPLPDETARALKENLRWLTHPK